ncbi:MAG: hypothetical protein AB3N63_07920 [Puniceicoccaceae bacterium]
MIWRNPIFIRFCRSELRVKKAIFWYLLTFIVTTFTVAMIYTPQVINGREAQDAARSAFLPILIIQGVILLFMGTGSVASGITKEKVDNVLNYQRLTPMRTRDKILGYLFGLPVRQYVLFGITLPFLLFVLIVGRIPPTAFVPYYLVFFSSTLLYHFTGMVAGMISKRWRWSARISQGLIVLLYFVLPQLSHIGLVFLEFLTVRPVFVEYIIPVVGESVQIQNDDMIIFAGKSVPFFVFEISGTLFSFIIQSGLIVLFAAIIARKWKSDSKQAISKPMAAITFTAFSVMSLGNIWPNLVRSDRALDIFQSGGDLGSEVAVIVLPLILALATTMLAFVLLTSALPDPMQFRHGLIRAKRHLRNRLSPWEDASGGYYVTAVIFLVQATFLSFVYIALYKSQYFDGLDSNPMLAAWMFIATGLFLFYYQGLKENFGSGQVAMFVLIGWALPILVAVFILAVRQEPSSIMFMTAGLSPITIIPFSAAQLESSGEEVAVFVSRGLAVSVLTLLAMNAWLHVRLARQRKKLSDEELSRLS